MSKEDDKKMIHELNNIRQMLTSGFSSPNDIEDCLKKVVDKLLAKYDN